ncbi:MAG TPA: glycosyltransferase [Solirubrobacterales bacterium]
MRIAMLLHKSVEHDSRVRRAARALAEGGHDVTVLHLPRARGELDGELDGFAVRSVTPPAWVRQRLPAFLYRLVFFAAFLVALRRLRPDAVHAHDAAMLAPGWLGARATGAMLVYDSHEYAVGVPYRERAWTALVGALEHLFVPRSALVITVSEGIAERLGERYRLRRPAVVVRNFPDPRAYDADFDCGDLRSALDLPADAELVLHLGAAALDRGCETLVRAVARMPGDVNLLFLGVDAPYAARLGELAAELGIGERVHFRPPVAVDRILAYARQASVGVSLLEDSCENHRLALPNKVFEYLAAGVPVLASDLPELRRTLTGQPGAVLVDPTDEVAIATGLRTGLDGERPAVPSRFEWSQEAAQLIAAYADLDGGKAAVPDSAVVLVRNGVTHDARVLREARLLESLGFDTTVVGVRTSATGAQRSERIEGIRIGRLDPGAGIRQTLARLGSLRSLRSSRAAATLPPARDGAAFSAPETSSRGRLRRLAATADYYRRGVGVVRRIRPRLIHANDYNTAWIGVAGKWLTGSRLVYDSHELWPDRNLRPESRLWLLLCESLFVRVADEVITTSPGYAQVLARRYRIEPPRLVRNVPGWRVDSEPRPPGAPPLAVYFGALTRNRGLATALHALALVPELRMRFVGPEAWGYREDLSALAAQLGVADRLQIADPVRPDQAATVLADADLGLALIEPVCLSYRMTLPNKLYEYVAAGLPVLSSEVPVLAGEVRRHGLGLVADSADPAAVAAALEAMLEPSAQARFRDAVARLAAETSWEREQLVLADVYRAPR